MFNTWLILIILVVLLLIIYYHSSHNYDEDTILLTLDDLIPSDSNEPSLFRSPIPNRIDFLSGIIKPPKRTLREITRVLKIEIPEIEGSKLYTEVKFASCIVIGEMGVGKTTMGKWLGLQLEKDDWQVFYTSCGKLLNVGSPRDVVNSITRKKNKIFLIIDDVHLSPSIAETMLSALTDYISLSRADLKLRCLLLSREIHTNYELLFAKAPPIKMSQFDNANELLLDHILEEERHLLESLNFNLGMFKEMHTLLKKQKGHLIAAAFDWYPMLMRGVASQNENIAKKIIGLVAAFSIIDCNVDQDFIINQLKNAHGRRDVRRVINELIRIGSIERKKDVAEGDFSMLSLRTRSQAEFVLKHPDTAQREASRRWIEVESIGLSTATFEHDLYIFYIEDNPSNLPEFLSRVSNYAVAEEDMFLVAALLKSIGRLKIPSQLEQSYQHLLTMLEAQIHRNASITVIDDAPAKHNSARNQLSRAKLAILSIIVIFVAPLGVNMLTTIFELALGINTFVILTTLFIIVGITAILILSHFQQNPVDDIASHT